MTSFHEGAMKAAKACAFHEARSPPQAHHRSGMYSSSSSFAFSPSSSGFCFFFPFWAPSRFAGTRVLVCWNSNDVIWSLWDIKRRRFGLFYFFKTPPKTTSFGTKSRIQTTSFWISELKQFQNDVILDFGSPKQCCFGMCRELKKKLLPSKTTPFCIRKVQNDVVLAAEP